MNFKEELVIANFECNPETAEILISIRASNSSILLYDESLIIITPVIFKLTWPGYVSLRKALTKGHCEIEIGEIKGNFELKNYYDMIMIPKSGPASDQPMSLSREILVLVHTVELNIKGQEFSCCSVKLSINTKSEITTELDILDIELKMPDQDLVSIPKVNFSSCKICDVSEMITRIDNPSINLNHSLAEFIKDCIPPQTLNQIDVKKSSGYWTHNININTLKINLLDAENTPLILGKFDNFHFIFSQKEIYEFKTYANNIILDSYEAYRMIFISNPVIKSAGNELETKMESLDIELTQSTFERCTPVFLDILLTILSKETKKPKNQSKSLMILKFNLTNIKAVAKFYDDFGIEVHNRVFLAEARGPELFFTFYDSDVFGHDKGFKKLLTCPTGIVHKWYDENGDAQVDVHGDKIVLYLPSRYHLGKGIFKGMNKITTLTKWTKCLIIPEDIRLTKKAWISEKGNIDLLFTEFQLIVEEDELNVSLRKRVHAMREADIYASLRNAVLPPFIRVCMERLAMTLNNTLISDHDSIITALQELDKFPVPPASFFKILMAHDIVTEINNITVQIRDYPFYLVTLARINAKMRSVLTRNKLPLDFWATIKNHYKAEATVDGGTCAFGICIIPLLKDLINVVNRILVTRDPTTARKLETKTLKPNLIDRYRYFLIGDAVAAVKNWKIMIKSNMNPYDNSGFVLDIGKVDIISNFDFLSLIVENLMLYSGSFRELVSLAHLDAKIHYKFVCEDENHWITATNHQEIDLLKGYRCSELQIRISADITNVNQKSLVLCYDISQTFHVANLLMVYLKPNPIYLQGFKGGKNPFADLVKRIQIERIRIIGMRILKLTQDGTGLQTTIDTVNMHADFQKCKNALLIPWEMVKAEGACSFIRLGKFDGINYLTLFPDEFERKDDINAESDFEFGNEKTMMTCASIEYIQGTEEYQPLHNLTIKGFRLLWTCTLETILADLLIFVPPEFGKIIKKKQNSTKKQDEPVIIEEPDLEKKENSQDEEIKITRLQKLLYIEIDRPQLNVLNEDSLSQMLLIGGSGTIEVNQEFLPHDIMEIDAKRLIFVCMESMETFVAPGIVDSARPVLWLESSEEVLNSFMNAGDKGNVEGLLRRVFISRNMKFDITLFRLPYCHYDFVKKCENDDKYMWHKEKRVNRINIKFPEMESSMESEHLWTVIDVIQSVIMRDAQIGSISDSELLMEQEFKRYGKKQIEKALTEKVASMQWNKRPRLTKAISITAETISLKMTKNMEALISVNLSMIRCFVNFFNDKSTQKNFELHKIQVFHNGLPMLSPLLANKDEYIDSNLMFNIRLADRFIQGKDTASWPTIDHLEIFIFPLSIDISTDIYNDIYYFVFPPIDEETAFLASQRANMGKIKPLSKRRRLPKFYRYVNLNEIKVSLSVRGWIGLSKTKIKLTSLVIQSTFKSFQELFDKFMNHAKKCVLSQVPSICIQNMGIEKKNFLPTTEVSRTSSFFGKFRRKRSADLSMTEEEKEKAEEYKQGFKLMFGK